MDADFWELFLPIVTLLVAAVIYLSWGWRHEWQGKRRAGQQAQQADRRAQHERDARMVAEQHTADLIGGVLMATRDGRNRALPPPRLQLRVYKGYKGYKGGAGVIAALTGTWAAVRMLKVPGVATLGAGSLVLTTAAAIVVLPYEAPALSEQHPPQAAHPYGRSTTPPQRPTIGPEADTETATNPPTPSTQETLVSTTSVPTTLITSRPMSTPPRSTTRPTGTPTVTSTPTTTTASATAPTATAPIVSTAFPSSPIDGGVGRIKVTTVQTVPTVDRTPTHGHGLCLGPVLDICVR